MEGPLVNRVAQSNLVTLDLESYYPEGEVVGFDLKGFLFRELVLREKDFREALKTHDWAAYQGKNVAVFCSADAIIPLWAYMLVATYAAPFARDVVQARPEAYVELAFLKTLNQMDLRPYQGQRMVIKGCSDKAVPAAAYLEITRLLQPIAQSILFGEPCSTVPVFKRSNP